MRLKEITRRTEKKKQTNDINDVNKINREINEIMTPVKPSKILFVRSPTQKTLYAFRLYDGVIYRKKRSKITKWGSVGEREVEVWIHSWRTMSAFEKGEGPVVWCFYGVFMIQQRRWSSIYVTTIDIISICSIYSVYLWCGIETYTRGVRSVL